MPDALLLAALPRSQVGYDRQEDKNDCYDTQRPVHAEHDPVDALPLGTDHRAEQGNASVPDRRGNTHRNQRTCRTQIDQTGKGRDNRTNSGQEPADEDPGYTKAEVLALDNCERARSKEPPTSLGREQPAAVAARSEIHGSGAEQIGGPGHQKHARGGGQSAIREEGAQSNCSVGRHRGNHVLNCCEQGENGVDGAGRELGYPPKQRFYQRASSVAIAMTAMPSPRPMNPIPSFVFAFRLTELGLASRR